MYKTINTHWGNKSISFLPSTVYNTTYMFIVTKNQAASVTPNLFFGCMLYSTLVSICIQFGYTVTKIPRGI